MDEESKSNQENMDQEQSVHASKTEVNSSSQSINMASSSDSTCQKPADTPKVLSAEPTSIYFGCLKPGSSASKLLNIQGGPAKAITNNRLIKVAPSEIDVKITEIKVTIVGGEDGDLIWDSVQIDGIGGKLEVPIIGYWDKEPIELVEKPVIALESDLENKPAIIEPGKDATKDGTNQSQKGQVSKLGPVKNTPGTYQPSQRTFKVPVCPLCKRNLHYDSSTKSWTKCEKCKSNIAVSLGSRTAGEWSKGLQELKKAIKECWDVLIGKKP